MPSPRWALGMLGGPVPRADARGYEPAPLRGDPGGSCPHLRGPGCWEAKDLKVWNLRRFFGSIRVGDIGRVRELLEAGVDANACDRRGRPAPIAAVRATIPDSGVVDALLEAGADADAMDHVGLTALDYARRRLVKLRPGPDPVQRSRSLDRHGNLRLSQEERDMLDEVKRTAKEPALAAEVADVYIQERRKAALRQFMPRRELRFIIDQLEEIACEG